MRQSSPVLGILGGLGPMATAYFYELLIAHTQVQCDQDHIDILINSHASTPDRTAFITGASDQDPLSVMVADLRRMEAYGAELVAIPCNTAHYFFDKLKVSTNLPLLNIMEETACKLSSIGVHKAGILATDGTIMTGTYDRYLSTHGIDCVRPSANDQKTVMQIIYEQIKRGLAPDLDAFCSVIENLRHEGAEAIILGCTELSLIKKQYSVPIYCIDSLDVLAESTIKACGKEPIGFLFPSSGDLL